jgi:AhpD family alkylhydroperoxidase
MTGAPAKSRIGAAGLSELGLINWALTRLLARAAGTPEAHLFTTLGRQRGLFRAWLYFSSKLMPGGSFRRRETELVILRVAHLRGCEYELDHHRRIARREGLDAVMLERVFAGPSAAGWTDRERALLTAVDGLVANKDIHDAAWSALRAHYSETQAIELCLLVGQYEMLATTIATLRIERDFAS